ncbi:uncharacterized protein LOC143066828 [Mytilus galloprovincialis]|uniref:uncharacterized protein LOC143066828 n=1 Tax=Mytilus galloprovincialis TaxID=29158 RepID=UPI003F7C91C7
MASIEMSAYEDIKREDHTYDVIKKQIETKHEFKPSLKQCLFLFILILTLLVLSGVVVWTVTYVTVRGTMKNFAKDTSKTVKLATEIKNMLHGMCTNNKHQNSYEKFDKKVQNLSTDMEVIEEKLDKIQNLISNIKCNLPDEWTLIQKRYDGSVEFHRNWKDYENGFGDIHGEFWLGNKLIAQLTSEGNHELRIDVEDWDGNKRYAVYGKFSIGDASTKFRLSISDYSGNAGIYNKIFWNAKEILGDIL